MRCLCIRSPLQQRDCGELCLLGKGSSDLSCVDKSRTVGFYKYLSWAYK